MPLPDNPKQEWPPKDWAPIQRDYDEASAWYSGDTARLEQFYGTTSTQADRSGFFSRFWERRSVDQATSRQRLHVPAAADVAATSADLLFGEGIRLRVPEAHEGNTGESSDAGKTEERLAELAEADGWASTLLEGAEIAAGLGGVYLRPVWDRQLAPHPMLDVVHADAGIPEFRWGRLTAVTFWRVIETNKTTVWRHLERHELGEGGPVILHGLYVGSLDTLGVSRPLTDHPYTAAFIGPDAANDEGVVVLPVEVGGLDVRYVPNVLPNRKHRGRPVGRSDTSGSELLMDALDETWSSWMRDIRLGKGRIVVPEEFLEKRGRGLGAGFDLDAEVFAPLNMEPAAKDKAGITVSQFAIRVEEHARTTMEILSRIVNTAGYSLQTHGLHGDGSIKTATEVDANEGRSGRTTARKRRYFGVMEEEAEILLILDRHIFGSKVKPMRPQIVWGDEDDTDIMTVATSVEMINRAVAASTKTKVQLVHRDWDEAEVDAEVKLILAEQGLLTAPDPTGGMV